MEVVRVKNLSKVYGTEENLVYALKGVELSAYSAKPAHPFRRNGAPFRLKLSNAQLVN